MSADDHSFSRRPGSSGNRKVVTEEDTIRRAKGEIACAECRRLKLKCDRQIPCSSCVRRKCPELCPNGTMSAGQSARSNHGTKGLSPTEKLQRKIDELTERVHILEDALATLQSSVSNSPHPLLAHRGGQTRQPALLPGSARDTDSLANALGSLSIKDRGEIFFGSSAGSESLFLHVADHFDPDNLEQRPAMSDKFSRLSHLFPFLSGRPERGRELLHALLEFLPDQNRASSLCETFFHQAMMAQHLVQREEVIDEIMVPLYRYMRERQFDPSISLPLTPHQISVLFNVFAIGALMDLTLPICNAEAEGYYQVGHAAIFMKNIFDRPEIATVQATALSASYHNLAAVGNFYDIDNAWRVFSISCSIAHSIGLHRDPEKWGLDPKVTQRRRCLFWELYSMDHYLAMATGRPPNFSRPYFDCAYPNDEELLAKDVIAGEPAHGITSWRYRFSYEVGSLVCDSTLQATTPSYDSILRVDTLIRNCPLPAVNDEDVDVVSADTINPSVFYMKKNVLVQIQSIVTIYLHRRFFAQAMLDYPTNPLQSKYAPSFLAASRSASSLIRECQRNFEINPALCQRWWHFFSHLFSAAMIVGSIVLRTPSSPMAESAFDELGIAVDLFCKISDKSRKGRYGKMILNWLRDKATQQYFIAKTGGTQSGPHVRDQQDDDVLAIFGGYTRVHQVDSRSQSRASPQLCDSDSPSPQALPMNNMPSVSLISHHRGSSGSLRSSSRTHSITDPGLFGDELEPSPFAPAHASVSSPPDEAADWPDLSSPPQDMSWTDFTPNLEFEPMQMQGLDSSVEGMNCSSSDTIGEQWMSFMHDSGILAGDLGFGVDTGSFSTSL